MDSFSHTALSERLATVNAEITAAAAESGRKLDDITTIVVTKFQPASLDRESLLTALASDDKQTQCFLQLNLTDDPDRGGVEPGALLALAELALRTPGIKLRGVMAVAPLGEDPARAFARVRMASEHLRTLAPDAVSISAGMSGDFREAIREGATHLRIGAAITGNRPVGG